MSFRTKRGRPRRPLPARDEGTPELRRKRAAGLTAEPLDLCLERGLLSEAEHRAGLRFRWLYTLKYGAPSPATLDLTGEGFAPSAPDDSTWRAAREADYEEAASLLAGERLLAPAQSLCLHHVYPKSPGAMAAARAGLALLARLWKDAPK